MVNSLQLLYAKKQMTMIAIMNGALKQIFLWFFNSLSGCTKLSERNITIINQSLKKILTTRLYLSN